MSGTAIEIVTNAHAFAAEMTEIAERFGSALPAMEIIGEIVTTSVQRNFEKGGRPAGWQPLSSATLAMKKGGSVLIGKGFGGGLLGSIHAEPAANQVMIGTDKIYAAIHQFGGQAGRGLKTTIPARPFLLVQDEDWPEITESLGEYLLTGKA